MFEEQLRSNKEPDLALFSIIVGAVENNLTNVKNSDKDVSLSANKFIKMKFPSVEWEEVKTLYDRFVSLMKSGVDAKLLGGEVATRDLVKRVADVVWNSLTRSYYKDRAHLQSIYSFLKGNKLDCFGVAFAVTAGCQVLGKQDVHLALSEDHAWVVFGKDGMNTAEVTWHGKGNEDKRGRSVGEGVLARSWLYVAGKPVVCTRVMELAALVSSINPTLTPTIDVHEVAQMQHRLLWLLYDKGHLDAYPMALGNLGDLDEYMKISNCAEEPDSSNVKNEAGTNPSTPRPDSAALYVQAIRSSRTHYEDRHVYPYTFQGGYYHRYKMYKEAFHAWACAGDVIRHYNYSRDDEEIYKEFSEIANELIPQLMKAESSGHSARSILKDPECFASLLRFYDGICKWEEGSQTPILHIGWAKPLVSTISKFDAEVRAQVNIICSPDNGEPTDEPQKSEDSNQKEDKKIDNDSWNNNTENAELSVREQLTAAVNSRPRVTLYSHKMAALKPLLLAERLNTHALQLQLTAQSQLQRPQPPAKRREDDEHTSQAPTARAKRARRER
ncbi:jg18198 [Pararge aegeria aegeria]|uniref:Menin n=3 Tax=Pararge aegeria TaxID=116150 RepID=A0A8S4RBB4_9NEOP|nr:jg18198 [Pararge aegeria aegeria]